MDSSQAFGLAHLWAQSDAIIRSVGVILLVMSITSWYLILTRALRKSIALSTAGLESGMTVLASIGSTAPFVGLFGTVWGIYHALVNISVSGMATLDKVAGPVGEALIMTAFGLFVAIPAVLAYNAITRANRLELSELDAFAHDLHAWFSTGARIAAVTPRTTGQHDAALRIARSTPASSHGAA